MATAFSAYQKRLFVFLSVATFFEGYDFMAFSQVLPQLRAEFDLSRGEAGALSGFINFGTVLAYALVHKADVWGRRRVLVVTILGYTLATLASGLAPNLYLFAFFQLVGRVFLIAEWAISMVIAAEEFPAERRGMVIGVVSAAGAFGNIACAALVPVLVKTALGFRAVYLVGVIPLLLIAYARRDLRETARFEASARAAKESLFAIWKTPHRRRVLQLGAIWFLCYICSQNAVTFWKDFAMGERGLTDGQVGAAVVAGALIALPFTFVSGRFLDVVGRRVGGTVLLGVMCAGVFFAYTLRGMVPLTVAFVVAVIGLGTMLTLLNTLTTELFPTEHRAAGFAWSNNLIGRIGYCVSPFAIGGLADTFLWGPVLRTTVVFPLIAIALIWLFLPETRGRELERTAEVER